jgi:pSer/pThr/pTyr-binding forkhead associated (FHA) protein
MYKLIIEDDEGKTTVVPLIRDEITIGRKEGNTIRLTERNVSRKHAKLVKSNGAVFIEDLTSYNGIKVNGERIAGRAPINEGDRIQIGDYQLALKLDKGQQAGAAPTQEVNNEKTTPFVRENGQPSIPTAMMPAPVLPPSAMPASDAPARLVVVSSNFAGQQFTLEKAAVVIGRTDENDIVVNHRSISRHHAKVVREGNHFHIVDLQSANGVRVNGEEYGKVELRRGDHVDLGHVRMRFVGPGEDFVFERDAQIVDVAAAGKSKMGLFAVIGLVAVVLVGGGIALMMRKGDGGGEPGSHRGGDTEGQVARLLLEADKAMKGEEWESAIAKCNDALKLDSGQELARDKRQKAEAEKKNKTAYGNFLSAADKSDYDSAVASYGEIAEDSVYRGKAAERYGQVKKAYLRNHLDAARKARAANKCEEARQHVEAALTVDEGNSEAQDIIKSCGAAPPAPHAAPPAPHAAPIAPAVAKPPKPPSTHESRHEREKEKEPEAAAPSAPPPSDSGNAEKVLQEAQDAYVHGQYANAIDLAKKATKAQPSKAWRIIGASNCFLKDRNGAVAAYNKLDTQGRSFLKYVCSRNAITVP